ncbi:uncharacterized protein P174DRAFT_462006 [Aspergillus novofumigatus IBT 16806]|uniref:Uncharacterized protein n=1 Tax=Aspergillus novofumigatus (strain IBT 16806) TaxID=1392255 RepID=A0A2I1C1G3_ASPN1|nr:uncharacterized protein P174DRAFT_462006 [Aspergillus novofumigatus IBT 16806]PKX91445.1 hypothetical protein P174DRAFT_462006 [Aspergillus novofumigatus IBT 16806]
MKTTTLVSAITNFGLISAVSAIRLPNDLAEAICGDLGVMSVTDLPEGVDADAVRICKEHPEGVNVMETTLDKRDCWFGNSLGCSHITMDLGTGLGARASATVVARISVVPVIARHVDAAAERGIRA